MRFLPLFLVGCAYKVALISVPPAVVVELPDGSTTTTPGEYRARWAPFNESIVKARARGYRPLELDLRKTEVKFGRFLLRGFRRRPRGTVELILVPDHGPTGTWTESDIP